MAVLVPLNTFRTLATNVTTEPYVLYTTPPEVATILLTAQATNVGADYANVTFYHRSNVVIGGSRILTDTELVKEFEIPRNDAASLVVGKIVLEEDQSLVVKGGANDMIKVTLSLLETSLI